MIRPFFSVVIPLYNKGAHIGETIKSVLAQSLTDFEIIVVDDGSTDDSLKVVQSLSSDLRLSIIEQANGGVSQARNRGVEIARGEYVAFLDADDFWKPGRLENLKNLILRFPDRGLYSSAHAVIRNGETRLKRQPEGAFFESDARGFFHEYAKSFSLVNSSTACLPRHRFSETGGFPVGVSKGEDVIVWIKAVLVGGIAYGTDLYVIINEDAENRSDQLKGGEIPYFVSWLDARINDGYFPTSNILPIQNFLRHAVLSNAAGSVLRGDIATLNRYRDLQIARSFLFSLKLNLLAIVPASILSAIRKRRHIRTERLKLGY